MSRVIAPREERPPFCDRIPAHLQNGNELRPAGLRAADSASGRYVNRCLGCALPSRRAPNPVRNAESQNPEEIFCPPDSFRLFDILAPAQISVMMQLSLASVRKFPTDSPSAHPANPPSAEADRS